MNRLKQIIATGLLIILPASLLAASLSYRLSLRKNRWITGGSFDRVKAVLAAIELNDLQKAKKEKVLSTQRLSFPEALRSSPSTPQAVIAVRIPHDSSLRRASRPGLCVLCKAIE